MAKPHFNQDFGENQRALELFLHLFLGGNSERVSRHTTSRTITEIFRDYGVKGAFSQSQFDNSLRILREKGLVDANGVPTKGSVQHVLNMWQRSYGRQRFDPSWKGPTSDDLRLAAIVWHHSDEAAQRLGKSTLTYDNLPRFFSQSRRRLAHGRVQGLSFKETNQFKRLFECLRTDWESFSMEEREIVREGFQRFERRSNNVNQADEVDEYDLGRTMMFPLLLPC